jgi:hypothetical protein
MLRGTGAMVGFTISARDGDIGRVEALYFDDRGWTVRYLVVDAAPWLAGRRMLVSPVCVSHPDWERRRLVVALTRAQVQASPDADVGRPLSRQFEAAFCQHYGVPAYWRTPDDWHLRSTEQVRGYEVRASDGRLGRVDDMLIEDLTWRIRYLDVATGRWRRTTHVLVAPEWIEAISSDEATIALSLPSATLDNAPRYDPARPIDREFERALYTCCGHAGSWDERAAA